jgi:succinate-semialdehyde dehydrogenase / glutarate-semialdehyde dehydrogenase
VHDEFVHKIVLKVQALKVGPGMDQGTTLGPLITPQAAQSVHTKVQEALAEGANCAIGGSLLPDLGPNFHEPTILTNVSKVSQIWKSETFGPVAAIRAFETEDEALAIANDCSAGLASYFCTKDLSRAFRFAKALECGIVGVNDGIISTASAPFGGIKESGLGREGSAMGLAEYLETKYVFLNC